MCTTTEAGTWCATYLTKQWENSTHDVVKHFLMNDYNFSSPSVEVDWAKLTSKAFAKLPVRLTTHGKEPVYEKGLLMKIMEHFGYDHSILRDRYQADHTNRQDYWVPMMLRNLKPAKESVKRIHENARDEREALADKVYQEEIKLIEEAQPQENETMKHSTFEKRSYINGTEAAKMDREDVISAIVDSEARIHYLKGIKTKSKGIKAEVKSEKSALKRLVKYFDDLK